MSRKKFAVFATGWASDILAQFMRGMWDAVTSSDTDVFLFLNYATYGETDHHRKGELNIINLPDISKFDGVVIVSNLLDFPGEVDKIIERCHVCDVPVLSHGLALDNVCSIVTDNISGMTELADHLIKEHNVKNIVFIAGSANNEDSEKRVGAVRTVVENNGIDPSNYRVTYTDWDLSNAENIIKDLVNTNSLPDAIICANDELAMVSIIALEDLGLTVPKDVIVTGFDCIAQGQIFYPSVSSVDQDFEGHGRICAETIMKMAEGGTPDMKIEIPCTFVKGESCGCKCSESVYDKRMRAGTGAFRNIQLSNAATWHTLYIERVIMGCESYSEIKRALTDSIMRSHNFEGDNFHIMFDPASYKSELESNTVGLVEGYSEKQDVIVSLKNGVFQNIRSVKTVNMIPGYSEEDDPHMYVFLPIHEREVRIGYMIFTDCYDKIASQSLREYSDRFNSSVEKARKAMYLKAVNDSVRELANIDALTHVKNRTAYESHLEDIRRRIDRGRNVNFGIILFDVNNLKLINDEYGHYSGDEYIKNSCRLICVTYKSSPVYRIGGDEFVVILEGKPLEQKKELQDIFAWEMKKKQEEADCPEDNISVAYGMAVYEGPGDSVEAVYKRADAEMYETKKKMKQK